MRSIASSFKLQYLNFTLRSSSSCLRLLLRLPVPFIFHSVMRFRMHMLRKTSPIKTTYLHFIPCRRFLSSFTICNNSPFLRRLVQLISPSFSKTTIQNSQGTYIQLPPTFKGLVCVWSDILPRTLFSRNLFSQYIVILLFPRSSNLSYARSKERCDHFHRCGDLDVC
jgi:hypothetical protein